LKDINRVLFIGLGGAGQRHLRVIKKTLPFADMIAYRCMKKTPLLNLDFSVNNNSTLEREYNIDVYGDLDEAYLQKPDLVVIATPTSLHHKHIIRASNEDAAIIVEKPGCMNHKEALNAKSILLKNKTRFLISFQRRFHPLILNLKKMLDGINMSEISQIDIKVSSYVPAWHPYENYKELYACRALLGGGVLLTESHEIDLILWLFGPPISAQSQIFTRKNLLLDVEDSAHMTLIYEDFKVNIELDFMSKNTQRTINVKLKNTNFFLDIDSGKFKHLDNDGKIMSEERTFSNQNMFLDQFSYFMNSDNSELDYINSLTSNLSIIDECKKPNN